METQNQNDTQPSETSFTKGRELENEFAKFMKENLRWSKTRVGVHLPGKTNRKGTAVDIVAWRLDERGEKFNIGAIIFFIMGFVFLFWGILGLFYESEWTGVFLFWALLTIIIGWLFIWYSKKYETEYALVECKNLRGKVNIDMIDRTLRDLQDYKASGDTEYKFEHHYFAEL